MVMMKFPVLLLVSAALLFAACDKLPFKLKPKDPKAANIAGVQTTQDPVLLEIYNARVKTRMDYNNRRFEALEKSIAELRESKETFGNGSWKVAQFYAAFACRPDEPEGMWELHDQIHRDWIAAKPESIAAQVAYADFLTEYAWKARGNGFNNTVSPRGWKLFSERLDAAWKVLDEGRSLQEKDPYWWSVALTVALGQNWDKARYQLILQEAHAFEPKFWGYETKRAHSLLPRWHGKPGDWEAYAEQAVTRPGGMGPEIYGRIMIDLARYFDNVFKETKASWPRTKEGLAPLLKKYPDSLETLSMAAHLAVLAEDRPFAKELFDQLDGRYLPSVWGSPEDFASQRDWAAGAPAP